MAFTVVLDTCVLYPAILRDTLLRLAERELYRALWSADIIEELSGNLAEAGLGRDSVDRLLAEMRRAFPDAEVTGYRSLVGAMTCDPKDRHVLAAAVRADAAAIVTFNTDDFPTESVDPFEVDVIHPDRFLLDLLDLAPSAVRAAVVEQAAAYKREPRTLSQLRRSLSTAGVASFAAELAR